MAGESVEEQVCGGHLPPGLLSMAFNFEDLNKHQGGASQLFLSSLSSLFAADDHKSASGAPFFQSAEWRSMFPTMLESLDRFDRFSTNPDRSLVSFSSLGPGIDLPFSPLASLPRIGQGPTSSSESSSSSSSSPPPPPLSSISIHTDTLLSSLLETPLPALPLENADIPSSPSTTARMFARLPQAEDSEHTEDEVDITPFLCMPQFQASQLLRIRASTLSKRWKDATNNRKWPFRTLKRLDREITTLLKNIQLDPNSPKLLEQLGRLLRDREEQLTPIKISLQSSN